MAFHPIIGTTRSASPQTNRSRLLLNGAKKAGCRERLLRQLQSRSPDIAKKISEYERIIRFRHALVHGYDVVRADYVWDVIEIKLPILQKELADLLDQKSLLDGQP